MCVDQKWIRNKLLHYPILCKCGKCKSCLQEKANKRAMRIKATNRSDYVCLFVQLDYENRFIPYVKRSELKDFIVRKNNVPSFLRIYRDEDYKYVTHFATMLRPKQRGDGFVKEYITDLDGNRFKTSEKRFFCPGTLELVPDFDDRLEDSFFDIVASGVDKLQTIRTKIGYNKFVFDDDKVSILYYPDIQKFFKRLRIYLFKRGFYERIWYFVCGEYGPETNRSHFHVLLFVPREFKQLFYDAICQNWKFSDILRSLSHPNPKRHKIQVAKDAANYVSSYVNCSSDISPILTVTKLFKPMWHYSQGFGVNFSEFTLDSLLEKYRRRNIFYSLEYIKKGCLTKRLLPVPQYVVSRYFPKFKGYSRLSAPQIYDFVQLSCSESERVFKKRINGLGYSKLCDYHDDDLHNIYVCIKNKFIEHGLDLDYFCKIYSDIWSVRASNIYRFYREYNDDHFLEQFDNIGDYVHGLVRNSDIDLYLSDTDTPKRTINFDPNYFQNNIDITQRYTDLFEMRIKQRKLNDTIYSKTNDFNELWLHF